MKEYDGCELIRIEHFKVTGEIALQLVTQAPRHTYRALSSAHNWKEYFVDISEAPLVSSRITEFLGPTQETENCYNACRTLKVAVDTSTYIITILAGLESSITDLASRTSLTIHIVGATGQEVLTSRMSEELYHLLPNLRDLIVGYIGPDIGANEAPVGLLDLDCCPDCQSMGRPSRKFFLADALYHDFTHSQLFTRYPPDLIAAFHSGHYEAETETWWRTLDRILDLGVAALFTTYNKYEAIEEEKTLEKKRTHFMK